MLVSFCVCRSVFLWDCVTQQPLQEIQCHFDACRCLLVVDDVVVSGSAARDGSLVIFKSITSDQVWCGAVVG
jgi:hypothetical protein